MAATVHGSAVELRTIDLRAFGAARKIVGVVLPDTLPLLVAIKARKCVRTLDRNFKPKLKFIRG